jgi:hypothetical protein
MFSLLLNRRTWRIVALTLLAIAIVGPWAYDLINVPAQYSCDRPNVRLRGDFCGLPIPLVMLIGPIVGSLLHLLSGDMTLGEDLSTIVTPLLLLVVLMPLFTSPPLLRERTQGRWQWFNVTTWGLAAIVVGVYLVLAAPRPHGPPWGALLYFLVALGALALELLSLLARQRTHQG